MAFKDIFKDSNDYNEKSIVGFASFAVMVVFAAADIISGFVGRALVIEPIIFNSFVYITLGAFGIAEVGKIFGKISKKSEDNEEQI